jgi:aminoglycoside 2'-N-acetyltransferase I
VLGASVYEWSAFDWHVLVRMEGDIVSHVGITARMVTVGGRSMNLGGVGGVATKAEWRNRRLAAAALEEAALFLCNIVGTQFILLVCTEELVPFYQNLGWVAVQGPLLFDQRGRQTSWSDATMVRSCRGIPWPKGTIDLCGLPW